MKHLFYGLAIMALLLGADWLAQHNLGYIGALIMLPWCLWLLIVEIRILVRNRG